MSVKIQLAWCEITRNSGVPYAIPTLNCIYAICDGGTFIPKEVF